MKQRNQEEFDFVNEQAKKVIIGIITFFIIAVFVFIYSKTK
jgi:hypothetical protein